MRHCNVCMRAGRPGVDFRVRKSGHVTKCCRRCESAATRNRTAAKRGVLQGGITRRREPGELWPHELLQAGLAPLDEDGMVLPEFRGMVARGGMAAAKEVARA